jgi:hypothetical protein
MDRSSHAAKLRALRDDVHNTWYLYKVRVNAVIRVEVLSIPMFTRLADEGVRSVSGALLGATSGADA